MRIKERTFELHEHNVLLEKRVRDCMAKLEK